MLNILHCVYLKFSMLQQLTELKVYTALNVKSSGLYFVRSFVIHTTHAPKVQILVRVK